MAKLRTTEATRWFRQAAYDLKACRWNISGGFNDTACFLAQQAAEKALKSLLYYLGSRRKALLTHSLVEMITEGAKQFGELSRQLENARKLDLHYIPSRYPNGLPSGYPHIFYGKETAEEAMHAGEEIVAVITAFYRSQGQEEILSPNSSQ